MEKGIFSPPPCFISATWRIFVKGSNVPFDPKGQKPLKIPTLQSRHQFARGEFLLLVHRKIKVKKNHGTEFPKPRPKSGIAVNGFSSRQLLCLGRGFPIQLQRFVLEYPAIAKLPLPLTCTDLKVEFSDPKIVPFISFDLGHYATGGIVEHHRLSVPGRRRFHHTAHPLHYPVGDLYSCLPWNP